jgi:2-polyprenyl-3-methyl-5-hydroxy-6-metoxy-1,4-benzoquinol methylase
MLSAMCPVCNGDRFLKIFTAGLSLRKCTGCGLYLGASADSKEASYATIDPRAYEDSIGVVRRAQSASIAGFVRDHLADGDWLDVGCGYGYAVEAARAAGYSARGIEPNVVAAEIARDRGVDVTHGLFSDETVPADVVSTLDVLEHLEDMNSFAELVKRKTRGLWVIKVPSSDGLFFRIAHAFRIASAIKRLWQSRYEHPHRVYFNESTLHMFLEKHGFDVVATRYLEDIPTRTVVGRLTLDGVTPRWKARLARPAFSAINFIERLRGRSDALLVIARPRTTGSPLSR